MARLAALGRNLISRARAARTFVIVPAREERYRIVAVAQRRGALELPETASELSTESAKETLRGLRYRPGNEAILSLPRSKVILRWLSLPTTDPRAIAKMIPYESASMAPWPVEESLVGYQILGEDKPGCTRVLTLLAKTELVSGHIQRLAGLGVAVTAVEVSTLSLGRLMARSNGPEGCALLVVLNEGLEYLRLAATGSLEFSRAKDSEGTPSLESAFSMLRATRELDPGAGNAPLFVMNSPSVVEGEFVEACLHNGVSAHALGGLSVNGLAVPLPHDPILFMAAGAALGASAETDTSSLLPNRERTRLARRRVLQRAVAVALLLLWQGLLLGGFAFYALASERARGERASLEITALGEAVNDLAEKNEHLRRLGSERAEVTLPLRAVLELYGITPQEIAVNHLRYDARRNVTFGGEAQSFTGVYRFVSALRKSEVFSNPELIQCAKPKSSAGVELVEFKIACRFSTLAEAQ